jgi:hypothetical protein
MATQSIISPHLLSPRKPLQSLSTNLHSPAKDASAKHASQFKQKVTLTPTTQLTLKDKYPNESQVMNASKKRHFDEVGAPEERDSQQTRASFTSTFSSFIDYDPPMNSQEQVEPDMAVVVVDDTSIKSVRLIRVWFSRKACY